MIHIMNTRLVINHIFVLAFPCCQIASNKEIKPIPIHMMVIFRMSSIFSIGIHTFIFAQRFPPVNIQINIKKNPINPDIPRILYAIKARLAIISMSDVSFMLNARPTMRPASAIV